MLLTEALLTGKGGGVGVVVVVVVVVVGDGAAMAAGAGGVAPSGVAEVGSGDGALKPCGALPSLPGGDDPDADAGGVSLEEAIGCASGVGAGSVGPEGPAACCMGFGTSCACALKPRKIPAKNTTCTKACRPRQ